MSRTSLAFLCPATVVALLSCLPREQSDDQGEKPSAQRDSTAAAKTKLKPRPVARPPGASTGSVVNTARAEPAATAPLKTARGPGEGDPLLKHRFVDHFERSTLGPNWRATSEQWKIEEGQLCVQRAHNHPVWLAKRLPVNARIEFDAVSSSDEGDIKAEYWGDGRSAATSTTYNNATSYLTIFGGWKNRFHVLARIDEHAKDRPEIRIDLDSEDLRAQPVQPGRRYHFKVERRDGKTIQWLVDDIEMLKLEDKAPLVGQRHEYFGFNNWAVHVCFDNLEVSPIIP